jgi:outer membrane protein TolC
MGREIAQAMLLLVAVVPLGCGDSQDNAFQSYAATDIVPTTGSAKLAAHRPVAERPAPPTLPTLTETSDLSDYLTYASLNNPGLEAAFHRWQAAEQQVTLMQALPDPQLKYRYFTPKMGAGADMALRQSLGVEQTIPWPGKLITGSQMAQQEAAAEFQRFQAERVKLFGEVKQAYYEYYYLGRSIAVTEENGRLLEYLVGVARARTATGSSDVDVLRAQVELGKLQNDLATLRDMRSARAAGLNAAMNRPVDAPLPIPQRVEAAAPTLEERRLLDRLVADNPQLRAMNSEIAARDRGVNLAAQGYLPDFMAGVEWMDMVPSDSGSAKDTWAITAGISLPIWWNKNAAAVRQAHALLRAAQLDKTQTSNRLQSDLKIAAYEYRDADRRVALYRDTLLPQSLQALKSIQASYRSGASSFTDLIDSQRTLLEFQLNYERSIADRQQRLAELEMLVGGPLSSVAAAPPPPAPPATMPAAVAPPPESSP